MTFLSYFIKIHSVLTDIQFILLSLQKLSLFSFKVKFHEFFIQKLNFLPLKYWKGFLFLMLSQEIFCSFFDSFWSLTRNNVVSQSEIMFYYNRFWKTLWTSNLSRCNDCSHGALGLRNFFATERERERWTCR